MTSSKLSALRLDRVGSVRRRRAGDGAPRVAAVGRGGAWLVLAVGWCVAVASFTPVAAENVFEVLRVSFDLWGR